MAKDIEEWRDVDEIQGRKNVSRNLNGGKVQKEDKIKRRKRCKKKDRK